MSSTNPTVNAGDNLVSQLVNAFLRHAFTAAAGALATAGAIQTDQQTQFVTIGSGLAIWVFGLGWSWVQKVRAAKAK